MTNKARRCFLGEGYYGTITPAPILRNVLENPSWYTPYTPYQAEIAQGRLASLFNWQTLITDLTGMPIANASLLDEASAGAEALLLSRAMASRSNRAAPRSAYFVDHRMHDYVRAVVSSRGTAVGIDVHVGDVSDVTDWSMYAGAMLSYPDTDGRIDPHIESKIGAIKEGGALVAVSTDLLALTMLKPPGEMGADIVFGNSQRLGVPMGYGGPHAAFFAVTPKLVRNMPGRLIGVSRDAQSNMAYRMTLQTREQHIRRERATSNLCTSQALLANVTAMYAVYHGPKGLRAIAYSIHRKAAIVASVLSSNNLEVLNSGAFFDTLLVRVPDADAVVEAGRLANLWIGKRDATTVLLAFDETHVEPDLVEVCRALGVAKPVFPESAPTLDFAALGVERTTEYLTSPIFNKYHSETELMRYMNRLQRRDIGLDVTMIPLGSCTMKLNAATEMRPVTWPFVGGIHPKAPAEDTPGYLTMLTTLRRWLADITGFADISLQPNSGATGELAGLLTIRAYQRANGQGHRNIVLIPHSAHGTNPATAIMAGQRVVYIDADKSGNTDMAVLRAALDEHGENLSSLMITYPSTFGVFEPNIREICEAVHNVGGQVYMDGANMNAQMGLTSPGDCGADVCHLNLHKTFCIPHGGGGPGMGPIGVAEHLVPFLPSSPYDGYSPEHKSAGPVAAAPYSSASILPISYLYIRMMGSEGLRRSSELAILSANYMMARLKDRFKILYTNSKGRCAHEFIIDCKPFTEEFGIKDEDISKRLQDYGMHAPTNSWPVPNILMVEPTESESLDELDRYVDALLSIRDEIDNISDRADNLLKNAPHTQHVVCSSDWDRPYTREQAAFPAPFLRDTKVWPHVGRIDNVYGDRKLVVSHAGLPADFNDRELRSMEEET